MKYPLIINENGDILIFGSLHSVIQYLEPIDVENNEYIAYDAEGKLLNLRVVEEVDGKGPFGRPIKKVTIEDAESVPNHIDELSKGLINFLKRIGIEAHKIDDLTLNQLIQMTVQYISVL